MSKVYVLYEEVPVCYEDNEYIVNIFSSLSAMITWLKVERNYSSKIKDQDEFGGHFEDTFRSDGDDYFMCYRVHDLIGETSHKTDKLVIKWDLTQLIVIKWKLEGFMSSFSCFIENKGVILLIYWI